jgi:chemotaxis protein histidine kinase CheA
VEKMGGSVAVESTVGEGTKFNLTFTAVYHP